MLELSEWQIDFFVHQSQLWLSFGSSLGLYRRLQSVHARILWSIP